MFMKRIGKKITAGVLIGVLAASTPLSSLSGIMKVHAEGTAEDKWPIIQEMLKTYGGTWNNPDYKQAINDNLPQTALQGNGDTGIVSYGNANEKTYLISKGDFRNGGDLITSAPFHEDDRSIRQIALGGLTISSDPEVNKSLTRAPGVTVKASSVHDEFVPEIAVNGIISSQEEAWASKIDEEPHWYEIDLGSEKTIAKYVLYHMGYAREDLQHFNTKEYKVSVSTDGDKWTVADHVSGNSSSMTSCIFAEPVQARYVRIDFIQGEQNSNDRARIAEFELFESPEDESIFAPKEESSFLEHQDITDADLTTNMEIGGVPLEMNNWLSATENTMITSIVSNGNQEVALDAKAWTKADGSDKFVTQSDISSNGDAVWASRSTNNAAKENPESWTSKAVIQTKILGEKDCNTKKNNNASSSLKFILEPGETVYLVTTIGGGGQTYDNNDQLQTEEPLTQAQALADQYASEKDIETLRGNHEQWWKEYWTKSYIDIGDEEFHRYYYGSLYYMGCTAREDKTAPGLYGIWVTGDAAKYNNDYHLNYNFMAPYYGMYSSNRLEGAYSLTQPIMDYMPKAEAAAKNSLREVKADYVDGRPELAGGIDDAVLYPVGITAWGHASWEADSAEKYLSQTLNAPFAASVFISYYNYSLDEEFLLDRAYPIVRKVANFYEKWCEKEVKSNGSYQYNLYDGPHEGFFNKNAGVTIGMVLNVYEFLIQNFDILKEKAGATDQQLAKWKDMYEHMAPVPVRSYEYGSFKKDVFALAEEGMILRPESASVELEFIHPGERLSFDSDPHMLQIARNTIDAKILANADIWLNINNNPKIFTHAIRAGYDPYYIMEKFRSSNISNMSQNFAIQDGHHGIEKAGGIEFINNMLLQSSSGILKVFPNWTGSDAQFYQLREKGAYLVSSELSQGVVQYIDIVSEAGKSVTIVAPWDFASVLDSEGNALDIEYGVTKNTGEKTITFSAIQGEEYRITEDHEDIQEADRNSLKLAVAMAEKLELEQKENNCFTAESWNKVQEILDAARVVLEKPGITQAEADEAFLDLITACNLLEESVFKTGLKAAIEGTKAILEDEAGLAIYTGESIEAVKTALEEAERIYADRNADAQTVNDASRKLMDAVTSLMVKNEGTRLDILILKAKELLADKEQYTPSSVQALEQALEAAETVAGNSHAAGEEMNGAYDKLAEAMTLLVRKAGKEELKNALDKANEIIKNKEKYLMESIEGLQAVTAEAQTVFDNGEADTTAVGEVLKKLIQEILKARLMGDVDMNGKVDTADSSKVLKSTAELAELTEEQNKVADVNGDGISDAADASAILKYAAEKVTEF